MPDFLGAILKREEYDQGTTSSILISVYLRRLCVHHHPLGPCPPTGNVTPRMQDSPIWGEDLGRLSRRVANVYRRRRRVFDDFTAKNALLPKRKSKKRHTLISVFYRPSLLFQRGHADELISGEGDEARYLLRVSCQGTEQIQLRHSICGLGRLHVGGERRGTVIKGLTTE